METLSQCDGVRIELKSADKAKVDLKIYTSQWTKEEEANNRRKSVDMTSRHPLFHGEYHK